MGDKPLFFMPLSMMSTSRKNLEEALKTRGQKDATAKKQNKRTNKKKQGRLGAFILHYCLWISLLTKKAQTQVFSKLPTQFPGKEGYVP